MTASAQDLGSRALETASAVRAAVSEVPTIAVVLGSGLGALADGLVRPRGHPLLAAAPLPARPPSPAMRATSSSASSTARG